MDVKEKLVELLGNIYLPMMDGHNTIGEYNIPHKFKEKIADYLISNGVTVQKSSCPYCCDNGEGHGMLKHSYDDEDGMEMSIHPSTRKENGYQSQAWWATVHFRGECRDFYIEVCPFCGRRLVPLKEERETAMPQPPKGDKHMDNYKLTPNTTTLENSYDEHIIKVEITFLSDKPKSAEEIKKLLDADHVLIESTKVSHHKGRKRRKK